MELIELYQDKDPDEYTVKINLNLVDDSKLRFVRHYLGFEFPPIPFLWHYDDFSQPFPVYGVQKINKIRFNELVNLNINLDHNLSDQNTDFYVLAQYKREACFYTPGVDCREIYISYHTWLFTGQFGLYEVPEKTRYLNYNFLTGLQSVSGKLALSRHYPNFGRNKKGTPGGIAINSLLQRRMASIHEHHGVVKFSSVGVCNFRGDQDNLVFVSLIQDPAIQTKKNKIPIHNNGKRNCVVIHIFRNIADNKPEDPNFQELVQNYFI